MQLRLREKKSKIAKNRHVSVRRISLKDFQLTGVLDFHSGVGLRVRFVNHLGADLLCQDLRRQEMKRYVFRCGVNEPLRNSYLPHTGCCKW